MTDKHTHTEEAPPPGLRRKQDRNPKAVEEELTPEEETAQRAQAIEIADAIAGSKEPTPTGDDPKDIAARISL